MSFYFYFLLKGILLFAGSPTPKPYVNPATSKWNPDMPDVTPDIPPTGTEAPATETQSPSAEENNKDSIFITSAPSVEGKGDKEGESDGQNTEGETPSSLDGDSSPVDHPPASDDVSSVDETTSADKTETTTTFEETPAADMESPASVDETAAPDMESPASVDETAAFVDETAAFVDETAASVDETAAPDMELPAPVDETAAEELVSSDSSPLASDSPSSTPPPAELQATQGESSIALTSSGPPNYLLHRPRSSIEELSPSSEESLFITSSEPSNSTDDFTTPSDELHASSVSSKESDDGDSSLSADDSPASPDDSPASPDDGSPSHVEQPVDHADDQLSSSQLPASIEGTSC